MPTFVPSPIASHGRARQAGFTLIEVLVAILVLSFGMLGVVGLQVAAMQANKEARYQSSGVRYARELAETMRANKNALSMAASPYQPIDFNGPPANYTGGCPAACTTTQANVNVPYDHSDLARFDLADWWARASAELPGLRLKVCQDSTPYSGNKPQWNCTTPAGTSAGQSVWIKMGWTQQNADRSATGAAVVSTTGAGSTPLIAIPVTN